jgi:hypothetical protein
MPRRSLDVILAFIGVKIFTNRYFFYLIDTDGRTKLSDDAFLPDATAAINRVEQIGDGIDHPGCRIRVRDGNGNVIFIGVTTGQVPAEQLTRVA